MGNFFLTLATADTPIVTPSVDRVLVSVIVGIKCTLMETAVAAALGIVLVVVNLENLNFESRHVFWIGFCEVCKKTGVVL